MMRVTKKVKMMGLLGLLVMFYVGETPNAPGQVTREQGKIDPMTGIPYLEGDPNRVLASVNGVELKAWQAHRLWSNGLGSSLTTASEAWIQVMIRAQEARRRGMLEKKEYAFEFDFQGQYHLGMRIFEHELLQDYPLASEEQARQRYEEDIDLYQRPMKVDLQHITVPQMTIAEMIVAEARKPEVNFDTLVDKFARGTDKDTKGRLYGATYEYLEENLGVRVAEQISSISAAQVIGPILGKNGYEVIKIHKIVPKLDYKFDDIKLNIQERLRADNFREFLADLEKELETQLNVVRSDEIIIKD